MQTTTPFIWFSEMNAGDAAKLYASTFDGARIVETMRWGPGSPYPEGEVMAVTIEIGGCRMILFNGGKSEFSLNQSVSLMVDCETQDQIDRYWAALSAEGGKPLACGWITDRFGLTWQITPTKLMQWIRDEDRAAAERTMKEMMSQVKFDIARLEKAHAGR